MEHMRFDLGSTEQIPPGQGRCFKIGALDVAVFRGRDGRLFAIENRCPHRGGPLAEGIIGATQVVCPLHGHKFDLTTGQGSEARECVKTFEVSQENENIVIGLALTLKDRRAYENCQSGTP
ncbi:MAG: nitrite reductase small subunit NirD [Candidatus Omnitrophica bacterium]|nr:nitrite reductase small subunit NirD [Candidatus Omnitrophota bacterium]MDE2008455.1 nitrite reductase small subunit NirD [Candidatus Omnitrophota bacterium]MDE2214793.1 nitrite reductase small subunit NirD [Candidatus Omnitrophota bacterium]MDE2231424.1 nitrite reductase small subunit NirD [Candidatus Omnitrophota bacterium]